MADILSKRKFIVCGFAVLVVKFEIYCVIHIGYCSCCTKCSGQKNRLYWTFVYFLIVVASLFVLLIYRDGSVVGISVVGCFA